jgi:hypothetical protein
MLRASGPLYRKDKTMNPTFETAYKSLELLPHTEVHISVYQVGDKYFLIAATQTDPTFYISPEFYDTVGQAMRAFLNKFEPTFS